LDVKRNRAIPVASLEDALRWYGLEPHPRLVLGWLPGHHKGIQGLAARWRVRRARGEPGHHLVFYARHVRLARTALASGHAPVFLELHALDEGARDVARRAAGVVCITSALAEAVRDQWGLETPVTAIDDAVDPASFPPPREAGPPRLVYTGQLHDWKGVDLLLEALPQLPEVRALVVGGRSGDDPERDALRARARALGVDDRVEWTGFVRQHAIPKLLRRGDIGVVPTRAANGQGVAASPLKLFEYMASELPVVASALPALRGVVRDGENGLFFREGDARSLAAAVNRLLLEEGLAARIAVAGRHEARQRSWSARAEAILAFIGSR
jgi:glycosyltransferase involved in cell wall biosynthesis